MDYKKLSYILTVVSCITLIGMGVVLFVIFADVQAQLKEQKKASHEAISQLEQNNDQNDTSQSEVARLKKYVTKLTGQMDDSKREMKRNLGFVTNHLNESTKEMEKLKIQLTTLNDKNDASQSEVARLKEYDTKLTGDVTSLTGQMVDSKIEMKRNLGFVTNHLNESNKEINKLKIQLTTLNETLVDTQKKLKNIVFTERTCKELFTNGKRLNGVYTITATGTPLRTFCNMEAGGYTVFQRRFDGSTDFKQTFQSYTDGFGDVNGEYWLGLENVHQMTKNGRHQLRVELQAYNNDKALYNDFSVGPAPGYQLNIGAYSGTAGDSLTYHNGGKFSTLDRDNDDTSVNCANTYQGAWWYRKCYTVNINAFQYAQNVGTKGMDWQKFKPSGTPMKKTAMMFREM